MGVTGVGRVRSEDSQQISLENLDAAALTPPGDVGLIERPERMLIGLTSIGLSGLGVPYILPIGMWALAAGSLYTFYQRMRAVYQEAKSEGG